MCDYASLEQLLILANLESMNAELINFLLSGYSVSMIWLDAN